MPGWLFENPLALVAGIAAIWFFLRFVVGPKRGAPGLAGMFRREKAVVPAGMGRAAIATLIAETRRFATAEPGLRGLILGGSFAARTAGPRSMVHFILLAEDPRAYAGPDWLARWPYPQVGHPLVAHEIEAEGASHRLTLRGSPPIMFHVVRFDTLDLPPALTAILSEGTETLDDPSGLAEKLRRHWIDQITHQKEPGT